MSPHANCSNCGAPRKREGARFCAYCGARFPGDSETARAPRPERAEVLEALRDTPEFARALTHVPRVRGGLVGAGCLTLFLLVWLGGVAAFAFGASTFTSGLDIGAPFLIVPLLMFAGGLYALIAHLRRTHRLATGALEREPAAVGAKRTRVVNDSSTELFTLEFEDGEREERAIPPRLAPTVAVGDVGVAFSKGGILVDFGRIRTDGPRG